MPPLFLEKVAKTLKIWYNSGIKGGFFVALKELKLGELSVEQKLGLAAVSFTWDGKRAFDAKNVDYLEELVRNHSS